MDAREANDPLLRDLRGPSSQQAIRAATNTVESKVLQKPAGSVNIEFRSSQASYRQEATRGSWHRY